MPATYNISFGGKLVTYNGSFAVLASNDVVIGGKVYPTVTLPDGRRWIKYNLDLTWDGLTVGTYTTRSSAFYSVNDETTYGWNGLKYGLLYNSAALQYLKNNAATLFPGWHVPTNAEWDALITACGGAVEANNVLRSTRYNGSGFPGWIWPGTDDYGFAAENNGYYSSYPTPGFYPHGGNFWSGTTLSYGLCIYDFEDSNTAELKQYGANTRNCYAVRLIEDAT